MWLCRFVFYGWLICSVLPFCSCIEKMIFIFFSAGFIVLPSPFMNMVFFHKVAVFMEIKTLVPLNGPSCLWILPPLHFFGVACSVYNNIHHPSKLGGGADLHCFKNKIQPKWEDPVCANGGRWTVTFSRTKSDTSWLYTVCFSLFLFNVIISRSAYVAHKFLGSLSLYCIRPLIPFWIPFSCWQWLENNSIMETKFVGQLSMLGSRRKLLFGQRMLQMKLHRFVWENLNCSSWIYFPSVCGRFFW